MRIIPLLFLMILSHVAFAERPLDGMYVTGGGFISETQVDFLGSEKEISDTRPMIFVGYGKTSRMINDTQWRVFLGIEGFYMGDSKTERGADSITRQVEIPGTTPRETSPCRWKRAPTQLNRVILMAPVFVSVYMNVIRITRVHCTRCWDMPRLN